MLEKLDSRFHGNDKVVYILTFYQSISVISLLNLIRTGFQQGPCTRQLYTNTDGEIFYHFAYRHRFHIVHHPDIIRRQDQADLRELPEK